MSAQKHEISAELAQKLEELKRHFLANLPGRLSALQQQMSFLQNKPDQDNLRELHRLSHSLTGAGATYGFDMLSTHAREVEMLLKDLHVVDSDFSTRFDEISNSFAQLVNTMTELLDEPSAALVQHNQVEPVFKDVLVARVLIVDDDAEIRAVLKEMLISIGHEVIEATNGEDAINMFEEYEPSIVLLDIVMPGLSGYDVAARLKTIGRGFTPIIFITSLNEDEQLAKCIEVGGDDFITKPFNIVFVQARIQAMQRIYNLNKELQKYVVQNEEEHRQARHVFDAVFTYTNDDLSMIDTWSQAATDFSGDCQFSRRSPMGSVYCFLADFTGHGLAPAVGTVLVAETFYELVTLNASADVIVEAINKKISSILPTGRYCAAAIVVYHPASGVVEVRNYGLPDVLILGHDMRVKQRIASEGLPLGVIPTVEFSKEIPQFDVNDLGGVVAYSDGITETHNSDGEMFGESRLENAICDANRPSGIIESVKAAISNYSDSALLHDDISVMVLKLKN